MKKLYRSGENKILAGVCGGLGEYFGIDPVIVRLIFILFVPALMTGVMLYIVAWIIIPERPRSAAETTVDITPDKKDEANEDKAKNEDKANKDEKKQGEEL
ncbi:MAG: PspC domain-containing protein [Halanaerobiaceae bacterium]